MSDTFIEFAIEWIKGADTATVTAPSGTKLCNSLKRMRETHPDKVTAFIQNKDGSICCHVPINWVTVRPHLKQNISDEERAARAERLKSFHTMKSTQKTDQKPISAAQA